MVSNLRKNFLCIVWHQKPTVILGCDAHRAAAAFFFYCCGLFSEFVHCMWGDPSESELCCQLTDYYSMGLPRSVTKVALVGRTTLGFHRYYLELSRCVAFKLKPMLFLASMGKTRLYHGIFLKFSVWPFEVVEVEWPQMMKFWGCDLKSLQLLLKVWLLTSKR